MEKPQVEMESSGSPPPQPDVAEMVSNGKDEKEADETSKTGLKTLLVLMPSCYLVLF